MYLITFTYFKDLPSDEQLQIHRAYIDKKVQNGEILVAGPKDPRTGGVIVATVDQEEQAMAIAHNDPYYLAGLADYQITKFKPVKYQNEIFKFIKS